MDSDLQALTAADRLKIAGYVIVAGLVWAWVLA